MSDLPQISEAEFEVMKIVWKHAPISTNEITNKKFYGGYKLWQQQKQMYMKW
mgnify:CR=1 FL=1